MNKTLKNVGAFALCLALLLGILWCIPGNVSTAKAAADSNLLADHDFSFENTAVGSDPTGWKGYDSSENHFAVTDEDASHGTHSLKLEIRDTTTAPRGVYTPAVDVEGLSNVFVSADFKSTVRTNFYFYFYDANGAAVGTTITDFRIPNGNWENFSKMVTVPTGAKTMKVMFYKAATPVNDTYIDNVVIRDGAYYELNENFDDLLSASTLLNGGWKVYSGCSTDSFAMANETTGKSLKIEKVTGGSYTGIYSPFITLGDAVKLRASVDINKGGVGQMYVYFFASDMTTRLDDNTCILNVSVTGEWATTSNEWTIPEGSVYARVMLYIGNSSQPTYFDNVVVTPMAQSVTTTATTAPATTATTAPATTAPATTAPATTAPATTAPATTAPATTAPATTAPATTAPATTAPATTAPATTAPATSPDTGDNTALGLMIALMTLSVVALVATKAKFGTR